MRVLYWNARSQRVPFYKTISPPVMFIITYYGEHDDEALKMFLGSLASSSLTRIELSFSRTRYIDSYSHRTGQINEPTPQKLTFITIPRAYLRH